MIKIEPLDFSVIDSLPMPDEVSVAQRLDAAFADFNKKIVVLDDDPTGTQTVHGVPVYTDWSVQTLTDGFAEEGTMFFILTNSRSFSAEHTAAVHREIAENLAAAASCCGKDFLLISRGDSTLRGHFPLETATLRQTLEGLLEIRFDGEILCPFFKEGGRYTLNNIHYVKENRQLIPAGMTEFAQDKSFGYTASHLGLFVEEKSQGSYKAKDCIYITLEELRNCQYETITEKLLSASGFAKLIVNAADYIDLKVFTVCWLNAMHAGKHYIARSAAPLTRVAGNISGRRLLTRQELIAPGCTAGGLVMVGSHVKKTTEQLNALMQSEKNLCFLEFQAEGCEAGALSAESQRLLQLAEERLAQKQTVVIYTPRRLITPDTEDRDKILKLSVDISDAFTKIVAGLSLKPSFILAKGGITSSDIATKGLSIRKATVMGQIQKGIPVWMTGAESKFPHMPYIIFPGNVGDTLTLCDIVDSLV